MKSAKKLTIALASLLTVSALTSCAKQEKSSLYAGKVTEEIRNFVFNSAEDVEAISDEDLVYIALHYSSVLDQVSDEKGKEIDLFGVPLTEKTVDGKNYREQVETYVLKCKLPFDEINVNEPFPDEILRKYIDEDCKGLINSQNSWDGVTGIRTKDDEIIYCGENDLYVQYSIRFTEVRTYYKNNKLVTYEMPLAHRRCFYKDKLFVDFGNRVCPVYFGELNMDWVKSNTGKSLYKEFSETEDAYICTSYSVYTSGGDWGLYDSANLEKIVTIFDKNTHETYSRGGGSIKRVDIPGTYNKPPEIW